MGWRNIIAIYVTSSQGVGAIVVVVLFLHYAFEWDFLDAGIVGILFWGAVALFLRGEIIAKSYYNQGRALYERRAYAEAEASYREAIRWDYDNAWTHGNLAIVLDDQGKHEEALKSIDKAIALNPQDRDFREWRQDIVQNLGSRTSGTDTASESERLCQEATVHFQSGRHQQALNCIERALPIDEARLGRASMVVAAHFKNRGMALMNLHRYKEAIDTYTTAVSIFQDVEGPRGPQMAICLNDLGCAHLALNDYRQALGHLEEAVSLDRSLYGDQHPDTARHLANLARAQLRMPDAALQAQGKRNLVNARETLVRLLGSNHPDVRTIEQFERSGLS
jgi:tetratricopeptide (TPR) repeat protein